MSPTGKIRLLVALAAVAAAAIVAGVVYATRQDPRQPSAQCSAPLRPVIVPGVGSTHLHALRTAMRKPPAAAAKALSQLAQSAPGDAVVQFNQGRELYCAGYISDGAQAFANAKAAGRNTYYEVKSDNFLHPQFFTNGYPPFTYGGHETLLVQGIVAQNQFHQHTAELLWARAAKLHPDDADAQVAAAVGRFDMDNLSASFSHLGPLVKRFPRSQTVRFHLGLLLAWTGQRDLAVQEFRRARSLGPKTALGKDASAFLRGLVASGTNRAKR